MPAGNLREAEQVLRELIDFFPESETTPLAFVELCRVLDDRGMRPEAIRLATQTVQRYPDNAAVLQNEGRLLGLAGRRTDRRQSAGWPLTKPVHKIPTCCLPPARHFRKAEAFAEALEAYEKLTTQFLHFTAGLRGEY